MIRILLFVSLAIAMAYFSPTAQAQSGAKTLDSLSVSDQNDLKDLLQKIEQQEKNALKEKIKVINSKLESEKISAEEADVLKMAAAKKSAQNIEDRQQLAKIYLTYAIRNDVDIMDLSELELDFDSLKFRITPFLEFEKVIKGNNGQGTLSITGKIKKNDTVKAYESRTNSRFILGVGFNNSFNDGDFGSENYKFAGSRYFSFGWMWSTRVFKESNFLRFNYGVELQFNGLKPRDNQFFVENGDQTELQSFDANLDKSKFRMDNLIFPMHLEFTSSRKKTSKSGNIYFSEPDFKVGLGGFAGVNMWNKQKLKYDVDGDDFKVKQRSDMNTNNILYGLSAYIGWDSVQLYGQYNLNPIFSDNPVDEHNFQIGLRFEVD